MADNYQQSSSFIEISSSEKIKKAEKIIERVTDEIENSDDGYCGCYVDIEENGVWIYSDEFFNTTHAEMFYKALVNELDLPDIYVCSWSYSCSKLRIDEFGGGAFAVQKGCPTEWVDAASFVKVLALANKN